MALFYATLGVSGLTDVGYTWKDEDGADIGLRSEVGVTEQEAGTYCADISPADGAKGIYWDSTSNATANIFAVIDLCCDDDETTSSAFASSPDFRVKQSGSFSYEFTAKDEDGNQLNLTGYTVTSTAEQTQGDDTQAFTIVNSDLANGKFKLTLTPTNTATMDKGFWKFDIKMVSADTLTVYFIEDQDLKVIDNIT